MPEYKNPENSAATADASGSITPPTSSGAPRKPRKKRGRKPEVKQYKTLIGRIETEIRQLKSWDKDMLRPGRWSLLTLDELQAANDEAIRKLEERKQKILAEGKKFVDDKGRVWGVDETGAEVMVDRQDYEKLIGMTETRRHKYEPKN